MGGEVEMNHGHEGEGSRREAPNQVSAFLWWGGGVNSMHPL